MYPEPVLVRRLTLSALLVFLLITQAGYSMCGAQCLQPRPASDHNPTAMAHCHAMPSAPSGATALATISPCAASPCVLAPSPIHQQKHMIPAARPAGDLPNTPVTFAPVAPQQQTHPSLSPPLTALRV